MTSLAPTLPDLATLPGPLARMRQDAPLFTALGLWMALSLVPTLAAMAIDDRSFQGASIWLKPIKFQLSLAIYLLTIAVFARWLPETLHRSRVFQAYCTVVAVAILAEIVWIGGAAALGTESHFNVSTPFWTIAYRLAGVAAVTLTSASLVYGLAIWRNPVTGLPGPLHLAVALGLLLTFALTVPTAGYLASNSGHLVGTPAPGDAGLALFGWSRSAGDLRIAHFFATHAMQALPLAGLAAVLLLPETRQRLAVWLAAMAYAGIVVATFAQALAGRPLL
jgi:hypothetical protein